MRYRLSAQAQQDLVEIYLHGEERFGPRRADRYADLMTAALERLVEFPELFRPRQALNDNRVGRAGAHIIVYRIDGDTGLVSRVRHGREDWRTDEDGFVPEGDVV